VFIFQADANYIFIERELSPQEWKIVYTMQEKSAQIERQVWPEQAAPMRRDPAMIVNLDDQFFLGPEGARNPYVSFGALDPCITVERLGEQLHIAARFNIETTILNYSSTERFECSGIFYCTYID